jgi:hypothetical protein
VDAEAIKTLQQASGLYRPQMAVGAAMAAKFRQQASTSAPHTELACSILCGFDSLEVAHIADVARENLPYNASEPAYEIWRQRLAAQFAAPTAGEPPYREAIR